jgi:hypothetical protein
MASGTLEIKIKNWNHNNTLFHSPSLPLTMNQTPADKKKSHSFYDYITGRAFGSFYFIMSPIIVTGLIIMTVTIGPILFLVYILKGKQEED